MASKKYLEKVLGHTVGFRHIFAHYHTFACTILDRVYFVKKRHDAFDIRVTGREKYYELLEKGNGKGVIFLGSHFGSFEVLRTLALFGRNLKINVMMYEENAKAMNRVMDALNPEQRTGIIPIGSNQGIFLARDKLNNGELVGILGDRIHRDGKTIQCEFLGQKASFPQGPLILASLLDAPVMLFFGIYRGKNRYDIVFEPLAERVRLRRTHREEDLKSYVCKYASILEHRLKDAPYNWFNFYDFWSVSQNKASEQGDSAGTVR